MIAKPCGLFNVSLLLIQVITLSTKGIALNYHSIKQSGSPAGIIRYRQGNNGAKGTMKKQIDGNMYNIGSNIRAARKRADLTQEALAEKVGVTPQFLSDLERGLVGPSVSTLKKLCTKLNVSADFILFGDSKEAGRKNYTLIEKIQRLPKHKADMVEATLNVLLDAMDMDPEKQTYE